MANTNMPDLATQIKTHIKAHEDLIHQLMHIESLFDFMLAIDFRQAQPTELRAQLLSMNNLVRNVRTTHEALQSALLNQALPQLVDVEKQI